MKSYFFHECMWERKRERCLQQDLHVTIHSQLEATPGHGYSVHSVFMELSGYELRTFLCRLALQVITLPLCLSGSKFTFLILNLPTLFFFHSSSLIHEGRGSYMERKLHFTGFHSIIVITKWIAILFFSFYSIKNYHAWPILEIRSIYLLLRKTLWASHTYKSAFMCFK